jgi:hypothetical protein
MGERDKGRKGEKVKGSKTERRKDTQNNKLGDYSLPTNMSVVKVRELFYFSLIIHHNELLSRFVIRLQCKLMSLFGPMTQGKWPECIDY